MDRESGESRKRQGVAVGLGDKGEYEWIPVNRETDV